jgi:phosphomannomutase
MKFHMKSIFRAYDVRGVYGKGITEETMETIGNALARFLKDDRIVVGRDARLSSRDLGEAFVRGFTKSGKGVTDIGTLPLGAGMFYAWKRKVPYAFITASHLPKEWNGVKFFHKSALGFLEEDNYRVRDLAMDGNLFIGKGGRAEKVDTESVLEEYVGFLLSKDRPSKKLKVVLDCGNGAAGTVAERLFSRAGFDTEVIFGDVDGNFPNRSPDTDDPLTELRKRAKSADIGIAYDGDGDRAVMVDSKGNVLTPEQTSYIILNELLKSEKGPIVANVECTRVIDLVAGGFDREVRRVKVGHTFLMEGVQKSGACFGVETAGHYVIPSIFPADDSLAVSYYFACILSRMDSTLAGIAESIPVYPSRRINFDCSDGKKFAVIERLKERLMSEFKDVNTMDGVRVDLEGGWALIRASNTSPTIRLTIEAEREEDFERIRERFSGMVKESIISARQ